MSRIIITGASGFIGKYLVDEFLNNGDEVYSVMRCNSPRGFEMCHHEKHHIVECNLENLETNQFEKLEYDAFFHLGWHGVNRDEINNSNIHLQSLKNAKKCLDLCERLKCKCFFDTGSRAEYGETEEELVEELICHPQNAYAKEKLSFYHFAFDFCKRNNIQYIHFRIFSAIGRDDHPWSLISSACTNLSENVNMKMGACTQFWNFMDVRDSVTAMRKVFERIDLIDKEDNNIINIASYDTRVLRSFIEEIRILTNSKSVIQFDESKVSMDIVPSIVKLVELTSWQPKYSFACTIGNILK